MAEAKVWNLALIPSRQHRELSLTPCLVSVLGLAKSWRASYCNSADIARGTAQPDGRRARVARLQARPVVHAREDPRVLDSHDPDVGGNRGDHPLDLPAGGLRVVPVVLSFRPVFSLS